MAEKADSFGPRSERALPLLDSLRVASPCKANWDEMPGDERVRFCGKCEKNVYNLSAMSREEAAELVRAREGNLCARMFQRSDGTLISQDCPVGVRAKRVRRAAVAAVGGGLMAAAFLTTARHGALAMPQMHAFDHAPLDQTHLLAEVVPSEQPVPAVMGSISPPVVDPPRETPHAQPATLPPVPAVMGRMSTAPRRELDSH
jgi:hypothetical protein